jgi:predicted ATP-dependent serine protease
MLAKPGMKPVSTGSFEQESALPSSMPTTLPPNLLKRMNPGRPNVKRFPTNIPSLDKYLGGGLPSGLTVAYGEAGSGKSLWAKQVATHTRGKVLYFTCEVLNDAPPKDKFPHVETVDYTKFRPKFDKAIYELFTYINVLKPDLVIIDSLTSFLGVSSKALAESDIRKGVWQIHLQADGGCPILGISEVRGTGYSRTTAGGEGVKHGCTALIQFYEHFLSNERYASSFPNHELGDVVYTIQVMKDKHGLANNRPCEVDFSPTDWDSYSIRNKEDTNVNEKNK